jgi:hypothetical protein
MPRPLEICLEDLDHEPEDESFVRCVALPASETALALDATGAVQWMPERTDVHALGVSADGRLILLGSAAAGEIAVTRGPRSLAAPEGQPVVLLDQDLLQVGGRRLRVHVHGEIEAVRPPERLRGMARLARAAATAVALGGALAAGSAAVAQAPETRATAAIEVRAQPPKPAPPPSTPMDCTVSSQSVKQGKLVLKATCPTPSGLYVGLTGYLLDPKTGANLADGAVRLMTVTGTQVEAVALTLTKASPARKIRFLVRSW